MKYTGTTYRPPFEANSLLLQVTTGCTHNSCSFCYMYKDVPFSVEPMEQIEKDLAEAREYYPNVRRVFLENGDPFALSARRLKIIAGAVHKYLPQVENISMYASVRNIKNKTDEELKSLRELGINELNIGVESGLDEALKLMNKGYTSEEAYYELKRLRNAGIDYAANVILGAAGPNMLIQNAKATADLLNETTPYLVFTTTLHSEPISPIYEDMRTGRFVQSTIGEYIDEEEILIEHLDLDNSLFFGLHPSNVVRMYGRLPEDKDDLLKELKNTRKRLETKLNERPKRSSEGSILKIN